MKFSLMDKVIFGTVAVGLLGLLVIGAAYMNGHPVHEYHYGDAIRFNSGFYKGCEGYLVDAKRDKDVGEITAYVANVTCGPDTFHFGLTPIATSVICSPGSFEVINDTTTEK